MNLIGCRKDPGSCVEGGASTMAAGSFLSQVNQFFFNRASQSTRKCWRCDPRAPPQPTRWSTPASSTGRCASTRRAKPSRWAWPCAAWAASTSWARAAPPGASTWTTGCSRASRPSTTTRRGRWTAPSRTASASTCTTTKVPGETRSEDRCREVSCEMWWKWSVFYIL